MEGGQDQGHVSVREQDMFMPIANVIRIMRRVLPTHAKISDDAKETIQECVSEYISFVTGEANERCQREQRKTVTAEDILWAMSKLGFDDYIEPLSVFLSKYREFEGDQRGSIRGEPLQVMKYKHHAAASPMVTRVANPQMTRVMPQMQVQMHPYGFFGENNGNVGATGAGGGGGSSGYYYSGSYGDEESSGAGSIEALPLMRNFDNHDHHQSYGLNLK